MLDGLADHGGFGELGLCDLLEGDAGSVAELDRAGVVAESLGQVRPYRVQSQPQLLEGPGRPYGS